MREIIAASSYYGSHATGVVLLVDGQPHHFATRREIPASMLPDAQSQWGDAQVVQVGWNVTHMGHHMKPDRRVDVEVDSSGLMSVRYPTDKPVPIADFLAKLTGDDAPSRLCRVWLLTDSGKQHCCWWYERAADGVNREMVEHFAENARRAASVPATAGSRSPAP